MASRAIRETLAAMAELHGRKMNPAAVGLLLSDLSGYGEAQVLRALERCRKEIRGFPTVADIIARIDDGRPGPEEAWGMLPKGEDATVVWTEEMTGAWSVAAGLMATDEIAARMAFLETYRKLVADARAENRPAKWTPSIGLDPQQRDRAIRDAVAKGRLSLAHAQDIVPSLAAPKRTALPAPERDERQVDLEEYLKSLRSILPQMETVARAAKPLQMTEEEIQKRHEFLKEQARRIQELNEEPREEDKGA